MLTQWRQAHANKKRDLYPEEIKRMDDVMRVVPKNKKKGKSGGTSKSNEEIDWRFAQKGNKEQDNYACYCCGKPRSECPVGASKYTLKDTNPRWELYKETGKVQNQLVAGVPAT